MPTPMLFVLVATPADNANLGEALQHPIELHVCKAVTEMRELDHARIALYWIKACSNIFSACLNHSVMNEFSLGYETNTPHAGFIINF